MVREHERCAACGFDGGLRNDGALLEELRGLGGRWASLLLHAGDRVAIRPAHGVWSALEYAAHSRDVTALHLFGVDAALREDEPAFPEFADEGFDAAAARFSGLDPAEVAAELGAHARALADSAAAHPDDWSRGLSVGGHRSDIRRLLEHALHDSLHHLDDVDRGLRQLAQATPGT